MDWYAEMLMFGGVRLIRNSGFWIFSENRVFNFRLLGLGQIFEAILFDIAKNVSWTADSDLAPS